MVSMGFGRSTYNPEPLSASGGMVNDRPSAIVGIVVGLVAWRRCRSAAEVYADLVEAAVDVHLDDLVDRFTNDQGVRPTRPYWLTR
jgi:hypothetical protein